MTDQNSPLLLTPGPLTTAPETRDAMLRDWGSRDTAFIELTARVRRRLLAVAGVEEGGDFTCVPLQGAGTFIIEAAITSLVPTDGKLLVLVNGAYGERAAKICALAGRAHAVLADEESAPTDTDALERALAEDADITHLLIVHCETTSGILNPLEETAAIAAAHGTSLIVDAMSSFGALPLDIAALPADAVVASANKCLEGVPGVGFAIVRTSVLEGSAGNAGTLSLDLHDQWTYMEKSGQWRFTPPTHVLAALDEALARHEAEGSVAGRGARYRRNCDVLLEGMRALGFETYLGDNVQAPIIVTFKEPADPKYDFEEFYRRLHDRGFAIYPGKLTKAPSFRIGCIGHLDASDMARAVAAVGAVMDEMGFRLT